MPMTPRSVVVFALTGIILTALGIRTGVAALSPLATTIELDVPLVGLPLGALGMIPPLAFSLAAAFSPWLARRVGIEGAAVVVAVLAIIAHLWRGFSPNYASLFIATIVLMLSSGIGNVILPALVKLYAPRAVGAVTAAYATAMAISATAPTVAGVWLADAFGWRLSLATWALVSFVGAIPWLIVIPFAKRRGIAEAELNATLPIPLAAVSLSRSPTALSIMVIFGVSGATAYTAFSLLPLILSDVSGLGRTEAALALGLFSIMGLPLSLLIPPLAVKPGRAGLLVGFAILNGVVGWSGLLLFPDTLLYLWVTLLAIAPLTFHLSLTLIGQRTKNHFSALQLSGYVNRAGYLFAAIGPLLVGLGYQLTGGWEISMLALVVLSLLQIPAVWVLRRERLVDDELREARP
ncbi:MAG: MFS transporter [Pontimonas sp.]|nr:MFS transporter [Pontimonas sp.]